MNNPLPFVARRFFCLAFAIVFLSATARDVQAGDWPQVLGPNRNGIAASDEKIVATIPKAGFRPVWQADIGSGFSGVSVVDGTAFVFHRIGEREILQAFRADTGEKRWKLDFATNYRDSIAGDDGPRCVPLVHNSAVYLFGAAGMLHKVTTEGKPVWSKNIFAEYGSAAGYFGVGSNPLIAGDKLLVNAGGKKAAVVAVNLANGNLAWKAGDDQASYSAPLLVSNAAGSTAVFVTRLQCYGLDPETGSIRFQFPFGQRGPTVNGATPVLLDGHLFLTASYGIGGTWARLTETGSAEVVYSGDETISSQYVTPISDGKYLYCIDGRDDQPGAKLVCFDPRTKKVMWSQADVGHGGLLACEDKILLWTTRGVLSMFQMTPTGYKPLGSATLLTGITRALPALSGGKLFVRNAKTVAAFDISAK